MKNYITYLIAILFCTGFIANISYAQDNNHELMNVHGVQSANILPGDKSQINMLNNDGPQSTITSSTTGGNWSTASTWVGGVVPSATDIVIINGNVNANSATTTCAGLTINTGKTLTINSTVVFAVNGNVVNNGTLTLNTGTSTFNTWCRFTGNFDNNAGAVLNSTNNYTRFIFIGSSTQTFTNNGTVTPLIASFDVANVAGVTISSASQIIVSRLNGFYGNITNTNKITIGNGGSTTGVIQRGMNANTTAASDFDVSPAFNTGSGGLYLIYDYSTSAVSIDKEVPASGDVFWLAFYSASGTITLAKDLNVTNTIISNTGYFGGIFGIGSKTLTFSGSAFTWPQGTLQGGPSSNLIFNTATAVSCPAVSGGLNNFTQSNSGTITLSGGVIVNGTLFLTNGILANGSNLTMGNGATINRSNGSLSNAPAFGTSVNVVYSGGLPISTALEIPASSGVLNNLKTNTGGVVQSSATSSSIVSIINEGFETSVPPGGWSQSSNGWVRNSGTGSVLNTSHSGTFNANISHSASVGQELRTPVFDCTNGNPTNFSFWHANPKSSTGTADGLTVSVSSDGGNNWTQIMQTTSRQNTWTQVTGSLESFVTLTNNMVLRFVKTSSSASSNAQGIGIDDVSLTKTSNSTVATTITINGTLDLTSGTFNIGSNNLVLNGSTNGNNSIIGGATSNISVTGTGSNLNLPSITNGLNNLTINRSNGVTLLGSFTIFGSLIFSNGLLQTGLNTLSFGTSAANPVENSSGRIVGTAFMNARNVGTGSLYFLNCNIGSGSNALGNVTIERVTGVNGSVTYNGNTGIQCNWDIQSVNPPSSGRNLTLEWISDNDPIPPFLSGDLADIYNSIDNGTSWSLSGTPVDPTGYSGSLRGITVNTTHFSMWTVSRNDSPLPVKLLSLKTFLSGRDINLSWQTEREINNSGFEIQRLKVGGQNQEFSKIGFINGKGTINTTSNYSFVDKKLETGKYKYRLKQLDVNGNFEYFNLNGEIEVALPNKFSISQNYPNPFNPSTKIDFDLPFDSKVSIVLYDVSGKEVKTIVNESRNAGFHTVQFNGSDLSSGIYFYRFLAKTEVNNFVMTKKMMLIK